MAAKKKTAEAEKIVEQGILIPALHLEEFSVKVIGDTPLIVHKWSEKAKKMIRDKQAKKAGTGREARDPFREYCDSLYWLSGEPESPTQEDIDKATFGFPATAFKACAIDAAFQSGVIRYKTEARAAFQIVGEYVVIDGKPEMREDMIRLSGITRAADLRYRPMFPKWSAILTIRYNVRAMSPEQIISMLNLGGFACGVGEWRPSKDGQYGMFHVATDAE